MIDPKVIAQLTAKIAAEALQKTILADLTSPSARAAFGIQPKIESETDRPWHISVPQTLPDISRLPGGTEDNSKIRPLPLDPKLEYKPVPLLLDPKLDYKPVPLLYYPNSGDNIPVPYPYRPKQEDKTPIQPSFPLRPSEPDDILKDWYGTDARGAAKPTIKSLVDWRDKLYNIPEAEKQDPTTRAIYEDWYKDVLKPLATELPDDDSPDSIQAVRLPSDTQTERLSGSVQLDTANIGVINMSSASPDRLDRNAAMTPATIYVPRRNGKGGYTQKTGFIQDGKTYLPDGRRIEVGTIVDTGKTYYRLEGDKGVIAGKPDNVMIPASKAQSLGLTSSSSENPTPMREAGYYTINGVNAWYTNPDKWEFGGTSAAFQIVDDINSRWSDIADQSKREDLYKIAEDARRLERAGTPLLYGQDKVMETLHANAQEAIALRDFLYSPAFLSSGGDPFTAMSAWFIARVDGGQWDYKLPKNDAAGFRVPIEYDGDRGFYEAVGQNPADGNRQNWTNWIYFDGKLWGADTIGNLNMAYVGYMIGLPQWVYSNDLTRDHQRDIDAIDYGVEMGKAGR